MKEIERGNGQNLVGESKGSSVQTALKMTLRDWICVGSIILSYILWAFVLVMVKSQGSYNCGSAFPASAIPLTFIVILLTFVVFFTSMGKRRHKFLSLIFLIFYSFLFITFILSVSVVAMCYCSDPATITKTYIVVSLIFAGDIAVKGAMFNGLM